MTISRTRRSSSSTPMVGRSCALYSSALLPSRRSLLSRTLSSYSQPSSQKHRWKAKNGFWMSCMGSVSSLHDFCLRPDLVMQSDFVQSRAGPEAKDALVKAVFGCVSLSLFLTARLNFMLASGSRSIRRTREAVRQFTIVTRGQEGSNFGFAW